MSALGQKQTCAVQKGMSALPPKADIQCNWPMSAKCQKRTCRDYSITSSTIESSPDGSATPSAFAVLRLMTSSNLID